MKPMTKNGTNDGRRISGSRIPLFLFVSLIEIQSENGPAVARPKIPPTMRAKLTNPTLSGLNRYGGLEKPGDSNKLSTETVCAETHATTGEKNNWIGRELKGSDDISRNHLDCGHIRAQIQSPSLCYAGISMAKNRSVPTEPLWIGRFIRIGSGLLVCICRFRRFVVMILGKSILAFILCLWEEEYHCHENDLH